MFGPQLTNMAVLHDMSDCAACPGTHRFEGAKFVCECSHNVHRAEETSLGL